MHNAGFAALGLNAVYVPLEARDAADFVAFATHMGVRGVSITAPFKISLMPRADEIDALATRVGAINTVTIRDGRWLGANTDVEGFLVPLSRRIALEATRVTVLGRAARRARWPSHSAAAGPRDGLGPQRRRCEGNCRAGRRPGGGVSTAAVELGCAGQRDTGRQREDAGDAMGTAPLDGRVVYDLVYAPAETELLHAARASGCQTIGGIEMLIAQAERQFELWTGQRPPAGLFEAAATASDDAAVVAARG